MPSSVQSEKTAVEPVLPVRDRPVGKTLIEKGTEEADEQWVDPIVRVHTTGFEKSISMSDPSPADFRLPAELLCGGHARVPEAPNRPRFLC
jgi:hypothetical protein